jgi:hypothetical protein
MFKRVPSARTKADSELQTIAPTSRPTIGNTLVVRSFLSPETDSIYSYLVTPLFTKLIIQMVKNSLII